MIHNVGTEKDSWSWLGDKFFGKLDGETFKGIEIKSWINLYDR